MPRDYKHRAGADGAYKRKPRARAKTNNKRKPSRTAVRKNTKQSTSVPFWRWGLVIGLVALFAYFLNSLSSPTQQEKVVKAPSQKTKTLGLQQETAKVAAKPKTKVITKTSTKPEVQFDFYTILPKAEFVVPDHEIKTRVREERVGKEKSGVQYAVQAGSFRSYKDADSLKAKLLLMGFLPKIEKAEVGSTTWYRVKMGPYQRLASVDAIQSRLKANKMDSMVMEVNR
ncbi:MAG: SPOR domain-containing protein [Methyloprofundus sp.]|nr:SPOR domain-containing protein [Methyloprofundus sp.]